MAIVIGIILLALAVWAVLPFAFPLGLGWGQQVINFIVGGLPILAVFVGLIAIFIGIADLKDRAEAKKEEAAEKAKAASEATAEKKE